MLRTVYTQIHPIGKPFLNILDSTSVVVVVVDFFKARALFREEELPQEEAASLPLPALLARVRAVTSERRSREAELEGQLEAAMAELREARGVEGQSRGLVERLRSEAEEATERWDIMYCAGRALFSLWCLYLHKSLYVVENASKVPGMV